MLDCGAEPGGAGLRPGGISPLLVPLLLASGIALRVAVAFPSHKFPPDADCVLGALGAFKILHGSHPAFFGGVRLGALVSYILAALFLVFGISRDTLALEPLLIDLALLGVWFAFLRAALDANLAVLGLVFIAFPSQPFSFLEHLPTGYAETLLLCATAFWLAVRLARQEGGEWCGAGLGLAVGLGFWNSFQTLTCTVPALLWVAWSRPELLRRRSLVLLVVAGFMVGALPWIGYNVLHPLASFHDNFAIRPASGVAAALDNVQYLLRQDIPDLVVGGPLPGPGVQGILRLLALAVTALAALFFLIGKAPARGKGRSDTAVADPARALWPLVLLTFVAVVGFKGVSGAGMVRGGTVRYVLPLYLVLPVVLASFVTACAKRSKLVAAALVAFLVTFNLLFTNWPWTDARRRWAADAVSDSLLLGELERRQVEAVAGSYWKVYPINFLSREKIHAVPVEVPVDYFQVGAGLPPSPLRWALVAPDAQQAALWSHQAGLGGQAMQVSPLYGLFVPAPMGAREETAAQFLERMRIAYRQAGLREYAR
jgi:hypothetical protein